MLQGTGEDEDDALVNALRAFEADPGVYHAIKEVEQECEIHEVHEDFDDEGNCIKCLHMPKAPLGWELED